MLNSALRQAPNAVPDVQLALRDQFVEGIRDSILRRELRKLVRDRPRVTLFEVREEALLWCAEERPRGTSVAKSRYLLGLGGEEGVGSTRGGASSSSGDLNAVLQDVVKAVAQQGKAISELINAVRNLTTPRTRVDSDRPQRATFRPRYTRDGQPICLRCEGVGHIARQCTTQPNQESHGVGRSRNDGTGKQGPSIAQSRAMRGGVHGSSSSPLTKERFLERAVGQCPEVEISIGGKSVKCLLDTGSNVSTLADSFFREHLHGEDRDMHSTSKWLRITAANKLPLPYLGYVELDIQVMGVTIPGCGFLIVRDQKDEEPDHSPPCILGMNIAQRCKQLILAEFDSALAGALDSDWRDAFSMVHGEALTGANSTVRIAGRYRTRVPAASVATVQARASKKLPMTKGVIMLEPGAMALPGGLVLVPTVVSADRRVFLYGF